MSADYVPHAAGRQRRRERAPDERGPNAPDERGARAEQEAQVDEMRAEIQAMQKQLEADQRGREAEQQVLSRRLSELSARHAKVLEEVRQKVREIATRAPARGTSGAAAREGVRHTGERACTGVPLGNTTHGEGPGSRRACVLRQRVRNRAGRNAGGT